MSVTMKDIANAAGVSVGTVDRALHNRGRIDPDVQQRILFIAEQMDYHKNIVASSLSSRDKHYKIAVVLHVFQNDFYTDIMKGIARAEQEIADFGIKVEVYRCNDFDVDEQLHLIDTAISNGASAMVIVPIAHPKIAEKLTYLYNQNFPVLFLSSILENVSSISAVRCNYARSGVIAAGLVRLIAREDVRILIFTPSLSMAGHRYRIKALQNALSKKLSENIIKEIIEIPNDSFDSYRIASEKLALHTDVNFIIYCGSARAGLKAIQDCGRTIHSIFYDCAPHTKKALLERKIDAVILQNPQEQGYLALTTLSNYLISKKLPAPLIEIDNSILIPECIEKSGDFLYT